MQATNQAISLQHLSILRECIEKMENSVQLKSIRVVGNIVMQNDNKNSELKEWVMYLGELNWN